jgi:hypothetical protein
MKKIFIIATTLFLIIGQETKAQEVKSDTTIRDIDLRLEKSLTNSCNGIVSSIFGAMFIGIGYATYKNVAGVEKNTSDYMFYKTHYENKAKLGKIMMFSGSAFLLVGGGLIISSQKKIKINLLIKDIYLSLH